jgi:hypothetical protein
VSRLLIRESTLVWREGYWWVVNWKERGDELSRRLLDRGSSERCGDDGLGRMEEWVGRVVIRKRKKAKNSCITRSKNISDASNFFYLRLHNTQSVRNQRFVPEYIMSMTGVVDRRTRTRPDEFPAKLTSFSCILGQEWEIAWVYQAHHYYMAVGDDEPMIPIKMKMIKSASDTSVSRYMTYVRHGN